MLARQIMDEFAHSTGLSSSEAPRRYLWTDAFAVCNYLGFYASSGEERFRKLALDLVDQVHDVLGRHRGDDGRTGWISRLGEEDGRRHPTAGGLRIGKPLPERKPSETYDPEREWNLDGQYYHYLTKWMHALNRAGSVTTDATYHRWAVELARAAQKSFVRGEAGSRSLAWKMSIDLSRALVPTTGHHDPLDGFVTLSSLSRAAWVDGEAVRLDREIKELADMCAGRSWATDDPLGVGGLLTDMYRIVGLSSLGTHDLEGLLMGLLNDSVRSLMALSGFAFLDWPPGRRLAFRELGLAIGLAALQRLERQVEADRGETAPLAPSDLAPLHRYLPVRDEIQGFWSAATHQQAEAWAAHKDISQVMLATCLAPRGYLDL